MRRSVSYPGSRGHIRSEVAERASKELEGTLGHAEPEKMNTSAPPGVANLVFRTAGHRDVHGFSMAMVATGAANSRDRT